jgi:hypothetical protein
MYSSPHITPQHFFLSFLIAVLNGKCFLNLFKVCEFSEKGNRIQRQSEQRKGCDNPSWHIQIMSTLRGNQKRMNDSAMLAQPNQAEEFAKMGTV